MRTTPATRPHGFALLAVLFLVVLLAGLSVSLLGEAAASRSSLAHNETSVEALELAETGLVHAEAEVRSKKDFGTDGIGVVSGSWAGGTFRVLATQNPVNPDRYVLRASGAVGLAVRNLREEVRRRTQGKFVEALFSKESVVLGGGTPTDAYDSRDGTYASQAVNMDATGRYALPGGSIGSNASIDLNGSGVRVRGNAIPGPLHEVELSGGATVTGDVIPRTYDVALDPTPYADFFDAMNDNMNNKIRGGGQGNTVRYQGGKMTLDVAGGATLTLSAGTYFFSELTLKGNSILRTTGPVKIYVTSLLDFGAGAQLLANSPGDIQIFAHPYDLPAAFGNITETRVKVNSGSQISWALYAPDAALDLGGGNQFYGAAIASTVSISGGNYFHYDLALGDGNITGAAVLERLYWVEERPPRR